jgi:hypothetical protein
MSTSFASTAAPAMTAQTMISRAQGPTARLFDVVEWFPALRRRLRCRFRGYAGFAGVAVVAGQT